MEIELTEDERRAIRSLKRLAKTWPKNLWLFSASGTLLVMRSGENGEHFYDSGNAVDRDYIVGLIQGIDNDGGDF